MLKKIMLVVVLAVSAIALTACGGKRTYKADGVYTAFANELTNGNGPQVTSVSVTIKNDKVEKFSIDCTQSAKDEAGKWAFNADSKKVLGYKYGMHNVNDATNEYVRQDLNTEAGMTAYKAYLQKTGKKEWFEQAELLEAYFKEKGVDAAKVSAETKKFEGITGVTIKDGSYTKLAKEALELAKEGKAQAYVTSGTDLVWVEVTVDAKGKATAIVFNTLQGKADAEGKFVWNAQNKQQLGYKYAMHMPKDANKAPVYDLNTTQGLEDYKKYLTDNNKLEWFEQVKLIADYALANGLDFQVTLEGEKLKNAPEAISKVTIKVAKYLGLLKTVNNNFK